jgi:hypothetical protein
LISRLLISIRLDANPDINAEDELIPAPIGKLLLISQEKADIL